MAWPHFIPKEKQEIYDWAEAMYNTWLMRPENRNKGDNEEALPKMQ